MTVLAVSQCEPWNSIWFCPSIYKWNPWSLLLSDRDSQPGLGWGVLPPGTLMSTEHALGELKRSIPAIQWWYWTQEVFPKRKRALQPLVSPSHQLQALYSFLGVLICLWSFWILNPLSQLGESLWCGKQGLKSLWFKDNSLSYLNLFSSFMTEPH